MRGLTLLIRRECVVRRAKGIPSVGGVDLLADLIGSPDDDRPEPSPEVEED